MDFYNGVARGLEKEFPDRKVIGAAYVSYFDPPVETRVHPNVIIILTPLRDTSELHPALDGIVQGLAGHGGEGALLVWLCHGRRAHAQRNCPPIPQLQRWNLEGVYIEHRPTTAISGINYYLESRLAWNWDAHVDDLLQQFCYELFGPEAGRLMVNFWYAWEQKSYDRARQLIEAAEAMVSKDEVKVKRLRYFKLGLQMVTSGRDMDDAIKGGSLAGRWTPRAGALPRVTP